MRNFAGFAALAALIACTGGGGGPSLSLSYPDARISLRSGEAMSTFAPVEIPVGAVFDIDPPLPTGLAIDPVTGAVSGTPTSPYGPAPHRITARVDAASVSVEVTLLVVDALPSAFTSLQSGWSAELVVAQAAQPARLAVAPDGRVFFSERQSGRIRVIGADGALRATPFATLPVLNDGHRGLLGLVLSPDFSAQPELFAAVCTPADGRGPDRLRVVRFSAADDVGSGMTVVIDGVPLASINVGGELAFDATGHLLLTVGDLEDPALAEDPDSPAGKVLRFTRDGTIPPDNPDPARATFCRGLRNTFALTVHPATGAILGADNGAATDDRLALIQPGRDFGWGAAVPPSGAGVGYVIRAWRDVIVPTALAFVGDDLYLTSYVDERVIRFSMSGPTRSDIDQETVFAQFRAEGVSNIPLCIRAADDGSLWLSTFSAVWHLQPR